MWPRRSADGRRTHPCAAWGLPAHVRPKLLSSGSQKRPIFSPWLRITSDYTCFPPFAPSPLSLNPTAILHHSITPTIPLLLPHHLFHQPHYLRRLYRHFFR